MSATKAGANAHFPEENIYMTATKAVAPVQPGKSSRLFFYVNCSK